MESPRKVAGSWVLPSFNSCSVNGNSKSVTSKMKALNQGKRSSKSFQEKKQPKAFSNMKSHQTSEEMSWIDKFKPCTKEDLAIHKKKVSEVEVWLESKMLQCLNRTNKKAPILVLTGPTGSGKTATIHALCKDFNIEVYEWVNSDQPHYWKPQSDGITSYNNNMDTYQSQASVFNSFLLRANKYSLFNHQKRVILVEDFPNAFLRDPSSFHSILRNYHILGKSPLIFIISDDTKGENIVTKLLPKSLQHELFVSNICFNPVAPMMMMKILNKINNSIKEGTNQTKLSKVQLEELAADSAGDIRNAVNAIQFYATPRTIVQKKKQQTRKRTASGLIKATDDDASSNNSRDSSLFLFHALGKILYCKRSATNQEKKPSLPLHLAHLEKSSLAVNPEDVFGKTSISAEGFSLFLHQNYMSFIDKIDIAAECASWLSQSEILHAYWSERTVMNDYASSLTTRGLMFNLVPTDSGNRWRPLHKPQYYSVRKNTIATNDALRNTFQDKCTSLRELQTELIPFLHKIGPNNLKCDQAELVSKLGEMSVKNTRLQLESLDVKEDALEIDINETAPSQPTHLISNPETPLHLDQEAEDEEIVIEDYEF